MPIMAFRRVEKNFFKKIFEPPIANKFRLTTNPEFLRLAYHEWKSSVSKKEMAKRVQAFLPELTPSDLVSRSFSGVRAMAIDSRGTILKEAQKGYMLHGRLLRAARVVVSKKV
jgi:hypothetical protein